MPRGKVKRKESVKGQFIREPNSNKIEDFIEKDPNPRPEDMFDPIVKKPGDNIDDLVMHGIRKSVFSDGRRFLAHVLFYHLKHAKVIKNDPAELKELMLKLEKQKKIINIGGSLWILPKEKK